MDALELKVDGGIGDFSWLYSKFVNLDVPLRVVIANHPNSPRRSHQLLELLPNVESHHYAHEQKGRFDECVSQPNFYRDMTTKEFLDYAKAHDNSVPISINYHLEHGNRIEEYLPELPTNFHYQINIPDEAKESVHAQPYLLLYPSSYKMGSIWKGWAANDWIDFANRFRKTFADIPIIVLGAEWDVDLASEIEEKLDCLNLVGKTTLAEAIEFIKNATYFVSFPSGLAILANVVHAPVWMFYPEALGIMQFTWADPESIKDKSYMASQWCPPSHVIAWLENKYGLKERIK